MNPFQFLVNQFPGTPTGDIAAAGVHAALVLLADSYSAGFIRGPGSNEFDYSVAQAAVKLGDSHPIVQKMRVMFADKLGR